MRALLLPTTCMDVSLTRQAEKSSCSFDVNDSRDLQARITMGPQKTHGMFSSRHSVVVKVERKNSVEAVEILFLGAPRKGAICS